MNLLLPEKPLMKATRTGFGEGLVELGEINDKIVVVGCDLTESTQVHWFKEKFPDRFISIGIAEQNAMSICAGLALSGYIPFMATYAVFSTGRALDQLRISVCYSKANVKIGGAHGGISVGPDGATHQALEDIAITRSIPGLTVVVPCDAIEAKKAAIAIGKFVGPVYIRFSRSPSPVFTTDDMPFEIGKTIRLREGDDVTLVGLGTMVYQTLQTADLLEKQGIKPRVLHIPTIKPIDENEILNCAIQTAGFVVIEEHQKQGGLGSAISEVLTQNYPVPVEFLSIPGVFGESGKPDELLNKFGLTKEQMLKKAINVIERRKKIKIQI